MNVAAHPHDRLHSVPRDHSQLDAWFWFGLGSLLYVGLSLVRLFTWRGTVLDLGWYSQSLWLLGHGRFLTPSPVVGGPPLAQAESFILIPLSWIYRVSGQPGILVAQSIALASAVIPLGLIIEWRGLPRYWISLLSLIYLTYPPIIGSAVFDFHPDIFAVPIFFWALWGLLGGHWRTYASMLFLAPLVKNYSAAITIVMALPLLYRKQWRWAVVTAAWGGLILFLDLHVVGHLFSKSLTDWSGYYGYLGASPSQALLSLFLHPGLLIRTLFRSAGWRYYIILLWPLGLIFPLYGLKTGVLWPALADMSLNVLSLTHHVHLSNPYNYSSDFAVAFLFVAALQAIPRTRHTQIHFALASFLILSSVSVEFMTMHAALWPANPPMAGFRAAAAQLPPSAPLYGQSITMARFPDRDGYYLLGASPPVRPPVGTYMILTTWYNPNGITLQADRQLIHAALRNPAWETVVHKDHIWLFDYVGHRH